jgi:hypothetical protein
MDPTGRKKKSKALPTPLPPKKGTSSKRQIAKHNIILVVGA